MKLRKRIHFNKGRKHSEETKNKISNSKKGIKFSEDHKKKIKKSMSGKKNYWYGKKLSKEHKEKISKSNKGIIPWNYIDGRSKNCSPARYGDDWFKIRLLIYKRDNYTCQECNLKMSKETGAFHIHHKIPFLISFDNSLSNLITLCPSCHRKEDARIIKESIKQKEILLCQQIK